MKKVTRPKRPQRKPKHPKPTRRLVDPVRLSRDLQMAIMMGPLHQLIARLDVVFMEHFGTRFKI